MKLLFRKSAREWTDALPLGNGRLGCMVYGRCGHECIQFNEDTLWSGCPEKQDVHRDSSGILAHIRMLVSQKRYTEAQTLADREMLGPWSAFYEPMGLIHFDFQQESADDCTSYSRTLDLDRATAEISYQAGGTVITERVFVSYPDNAAVIRLHADKEGALSLGVSMDSLLRHTSGCSQAEDGSSAERSLVMNGQAPSSGPNTFGPGEPCVVYDSALGMKFTARLAVSVSDGTVSDGNGCLRVAGATDVICILTAATSFGGKNCAGLCADMEHAVLGKPYEELEDAHVRDFSALYGNVSFSLCGGDEDETDVERGIAEVKDGASTARLAPLYFQYGRYLLASCSRSGTQAANLQGIWNCDLRPAWNCNYTTNINLEMNYWPADSCGLSGCEEPLFSLLKKLSVNGAVTARTRYGCGGWTAHHNSDLWGKTTPAGGSSEWALWPFGGAWLATHIYEHYLFTGDREFLADMYPVLKGAAQFLLDWLVQDDNGMLVTCPSVSPENNFIDPSTGMKCCVSAASTMDMSITRELFRQCRAAAAVLGTDGGFSSRLAEAEKKLVPFKVGRYGQLQEWLEDFDEYEKGHRHVSHLFGLFPGHQIDRKKNAPLADACRISLERRLENGGAHTGWSCAWTACLYARLGDGEKADSCLRTLFSRLTYGNLFNMCPPFQIDGNFGGTAAIAEMLVQSTEESVTLLPALPSLWTSGRITGLHTRQGFAIDIAWKNSMLEEAVIRSSRTCLCTIMYDGERNTAGKFPYVLHAAAGKTYTIKT